MGNAEYMGTRCQGGRVIGDKKLQNISLGGLVGIMHMV